MQCTFDKNRAAVNLFATAPDWGSGTYTNLLTHGSFEVTSGTVEVRRNHEVNPVFASASNAWTSNNSAFAASVSTSGGRTAGRMVGTLASAYTASMGYQFNNNSTRYTVAAGEVWTLSAYVRSTTAGAFAVKARWRVDATGAEVSAVAGSDIAVPANVWTRVYGTFTVPASGVGALMGALDLRSAFPAGTQIEMCDVLAEKSPVLGDFFYGSFSPDSDLTAAWTGTANASASTLTGAGVAGVSTAFPERASRVQSTQWNKYGGKSVRIIPQTSGVTGVSFAEISNVPGFEAGQKYTFVAVARLNAKQTGPLASMSRKLWIVTSAGNIETLPSFPNEAGEHVYMVEFTSPISGQISFRLCSGAGPGGGDVWWDAALVVKGALPVGVTYWDGANKPASIPGSTTAWTGNPNASTSTLTIPAITSARIERLTNNTWQTIRGGTPPSTGYVALADQEMPLNQIVRYRISGFSGETLVRRYELEADTALEGSCTFIKVAGKPNLSTCFDVPRDRYEMSSATQGGTYDVLGGGSLGVSSASGIAATRMTIQALAKTDEAAHALEMLFESHRIVFLQPVGHKAYPEGWYYIESVSWGMRADGQKKEGRSFTFPVVRTSRPGGESAGVAGSSYRLDRAKYPTYADIPEDLTYFELLQGA